MIPRKIHYVWFGGSKKSDLVTRCIDTWKIHLPNYEIIEWNETNFDVTQNPYAQQAYEEKKWAFVSDFTRLKVLHEFGGIYLDSDVEIFKSLDPFLIHEAFTGFERFKGTLSPITAVLGAVKDNWWIEELLKDYDEASFESLLTNTSRISSNLIQKHGIIVNNEKQEFGGVHIYPAEFFCDPDQGGYSRHHFNGSWLPLKSKIMKRVRRVVGEK